MPSGSGYNYTKAMNKKLSSGYRELPHTADWALEVWAPDMGGLFQESARGMYALMGVTLQAQPFQKRQLQLVADDHESLLVSFLSELLYFLEQEGLAFDAEEVKIKELTLETTLAGTLVDGYSKEIKAVTYHNLVIQQEKGRLEVTVVFDV
jgi:SHS2 domain-containing protein